MKKFDIFVMFISPLITYWIVVYFNINSVLISSLLVFGLPSLYIILRNRNISAKSFLFALVFSIPMGIIIDTLAVLNGAYIIPKTLFPFKIFGISTVELYIFAFLWILLSILFYEHFFDRGQKKDKISPHMKSIIIILSIMSLAIIIALYTNKNLLYIPYGYFTMSVVLVILPLVIFVYYYRKLLPKFTLVSIYFFYFLMTYEIAALKTNEWIFPGQFIGMVTVGVLQFPIEELIIWGVICTPSLLAYYEFFADDRK